MSFQWTFLVSFLYFEIAFVIILLLPLISPVYWRKIFKSRIITAFSARAVYWFNFIILLFGVLFVDAIRDLKRYSAIDAKDLVTPQSEVQAHMKQFRSQRNFFIAGFALFLWFVIKRLISLISVAAHEMIDSATLRKQAEGARRHLEGQSQNSSGKSNSEEKTISSDADSKIYAAEIEKYKKEVAQASDSMATWREKYEKSVEEYDRLSEEHQKLQNKLAVLLGNESAKDK